MPPLPPHPDLDQLRTQAKELLRSARAGDEAAAARLDGAAGGWTLATAQRAVARSHGFPSWARLTVDVQTRNAPDTGDVRALVRLLADEPALAHAVLDRWSDHPLGVTPLGYVAMLRLDTSCGIWRDVRGTGALARLLVAAGAPVDGRPTGRETPLITAASYGDVEVARVLVDAGAALETTAAADAGGVPGGTALVHAAVFGMTDVLDALVAAGAHIAGIEIAAAAGDLGEALAGQPTPEARVRALVMAADHQRLHVIDQLVAADTPIDEVDSFGRHPLRTAASHGRDRSVRRLLDLGSDPALADADGLTALDLARRGRDQVSDPSHHDRVVALLAAASTS